MGRDSYKILLWIQNIPGTYETVLSCDGERVQSETKEYIYLFQELTSQQLDGYRTPTLSLRIKRMSRLRVVSEKPCMTLLSGLFEQKDKSGRRICYRALIVGAKNREEECALLIKESNLYGCSISEEDESVLKKKDRNPFIIIVVITLIIVLIWILIVQKM